MTSVLINENINSEIFYQWLIDNLLRIAPKKSVIVLDNATLLKHIKQKEQNSVEYIFDNFI